MLVVLIPASASACVSDFPSLGSRTFAPSRCFTAPCRVRATFAEHRAAVNSRDHLQYQKKTLRLQSTSRSNSSAFTFWVKNGGRSVTLQLTSFNQPVTLPPRQITPEGLAAIFGRIATIAPTLTPPPPSRLGPPRRRTTSLSHWCRRCGTSAKSPLSEIDLTLID